MLKEAGAEAVARAARLQTDADRRAAIEKAVQTHVDKMTFGERVREASSEKDWLWYTLAVVFAFIMAYPERVLRRFN